MKMSFIFCAPAVKRGCRFKNTVNRWRVIFPIFTFLRALMIRSGSSSSCATLPLFAIWIWFWTSPNRFHWLSWIAWSSASGWDIPMSIQFGSSDWSFPSKILMQPLTLFGQVFLYRFLVLALATLNVRQYPTHGFGHSTKHSREPKQKSKIIILILNFGFKRLTPSWRKSCFHSSPRQLGNAAHRS